MSENQSRARPETTSESLGGPWATSAWVWLLLVVPALVMSGYQDSSVKFPSAWIAALVAITECAVAIVPFAVAWILRRRTKTIPLPLCILFWASVGIVHGLAAGYLAASLGGVEPHYATRAIFWAITCLIWLPLTTYAIAQFASRRRLLSSLAESVGRESSTNAGSAQEISEFHSLIVAAMKANIRPVVVEIARSLESIGPSLDANRLMALGQRLADVTQETTRIIETTAIPVALPSANHRPAPLLPVVAALDYEQDRPVRAAFLTAAALVPVAVAFSLHHLTVTALGLGTTAIVLTVAVAVMILGIVTQRLRVFRTHRARVGAAIAVYLVAGLAAAAAAWVGPWQPPNRQNYVLAGLLVLAVPFAAAALSAAVGLGNANLALVLQIAAVEHDIQQVHVHMDGRRSDVRERLSLVTHGPLRGRLAACAMALNFHAAEIGHVSAGRTDGVTTSVLERLGDVLHELDALR